MGKEFVYKNFTSSADPTRYRIIGYYGGMIDSFDRMSDKTNMYWTFQDLNFIVTSELEFYG